MRNVLGVVSECGEPGQGSSDLPVGKARRSGNLLSNDSLHAPKMSHSPPLCKPFFILYSYSLTSIVFNYDRCLIHQLH